LIARDRFQIRESTGIIVTTENPTTGLLSKDNFPPSSNVLFLAGLLLSQMIPLAFFSGFRRN